MIGCTRSKSDLKGFDFIIRGTHCVSNIIDDDGRLGSSVIHRGQAVISLLSGRVPNLKLYCCIIQTDCLCEESSQKGKKNRNVYDMTAMCISLYDQNDTFSTSLLLSYLRLDVQRGRMRNMRHHDQAIQKVFDILCTVMWSRIQQNVLPLITAAQDKIFGVVGANSRMGRALKCSAIVLWATRVRVLVRKTFLIPPPSRFLSTLHNPTAIKGKNTS